MVTLTRFPGNPILTPNRKNLWESEAAFNGCPIVSDDTCHLLYRACSTPRAIGAKTLELSTIGLGTSIDRIHFTKRRQLIVPQHNWERFGCEDPRVTKIDRQYTIFYTAISDWPPRPPGIKVGLALTDDFKTIKEKHLVTPFNAKAMTLFPEPVGGKLTAMLTVNPDIPPSTIALASFDTLSRVWDHAFWDRWHVQFKEHAVPLLRSPHDHVEIGAPPIKTSRGWLLIYSYIKSYLTSHKFFTIEAALLDPDDPRRIISRSRRPLLYPEQDYELMGKIPNIVFPSGAIVHNNNLGIYYGAADTTVCLATCSLSELLDDMTPDAQ